MDAEHGVQPLGFLVHARVAAIAEQVGAVGRQHGAGVTQLAHRAAQLGPARLGILHGHQRDGLQARAHLDELLVHERVVGAAQRYRPLAVLDEAHEEAERGVEHDRLHAALVERAQPRLGVAGGVAQRAEHPAVPAVPRVERRDTRPPTVGLVEILRHLLLALGDVAIGIDDRHRFILQVGIASGLITWAGGSPRPTARICSRASARFARRPASLWPMLCGVRISRSASTSR